MATARSAAADNTATTKYTTVSRAVRVTVSRGSYFLKAMVAKHKIDMNGNGVWTDSFDSTDPLHSKSGQFPLDDPTKLLSNGDVASNDSIVNAINIGNANIHGHVSVGPKGTINLGPNGSVGTILWDLTHDGVQDGYFTDDMNFTFPSVVLPYSTGLSPSKNVTINTTNYVTLGVTNLITSAVAPVPIPIGGVTTNITYSTTSIKPSPVPYGTTTNVLTTTTTSKTFPLLGTYVGSVTLLQNGKFEYNLITGTNYTYPTFTYTYANITLNTTFTVTSVFYDYVIQGGAGNLAPVEFCVDQINGGKILVLGNARLVVKNNFSLGGNGSKNNLTLGPDAKLEMFVGGTSCDISGTGVVNGTGFARNFICWCTDAVTSISLNGNGAFVGVLAAPNAQLTLNGGGSLSEDFIGCIIASSIKMNGTFRFHYDEALKYMGNGRYLVSSWDEIPTF